MRHNQASISFDVDGNAVLSAGSFPSSLEIDNARFVYSIEARHSKILTPAQRRYWVAVGSKEPRKSERFV